MKIGFKILLLAVTGVTTYILVKGLGANGTKTEPKKENDTTIKEDITNAVKDVITGVSKGVVNKTDVINFDVPISLKNLPLTSVKTSIQKNTTAGISSSG